MKKLLIAVLLVSVATSAFGIGIGVYGEGGIFRQIVTFPGEGRNDYDKIPFAAGIAVDIPLQGVGIEARLGYGMYQGFTIRTYDENGKQWTEPVTNDTEQQTWISGAVLFRFPFGSKAFSFFPIIGAQYDYNLTYTDVSIEAGRYDLKPTLTELEKANLDRVWLKAGFGVNVGLGRFFIRPEILFGYRLQSELEKDMDGATGRTFALTGGILAGFNL